MSGFSAEWLALREPYDRAARNAAVLDAVADAFADRAAISVVDLACGTGATLRAVGPHLPPRQNWRLVDNNLSSARAGIGAGKSAAPDRCRRSRSISCAISSSRSTGRSISSPPRRCSIWCRANGSTGSSSRRRRGGCRSMRRSPMTAGPSPSRPARSTREILAGFNAHQRTDKGFGPALGPAAAARARRALRAFRLHRRAGPFRLGVRPEDRDHPGCAVRRLGRARAADHVDWPPTRSRNGSRGAAPIWTQAGRACGSVTSTSSPGRPATR